MREWILSVVWFCVAVAIGLVVVAWLVVLLIAESIGSWRSAAVAAAAKRDVGSGATTGALSEA